MIKTILPSLFKLAACVAALACAGAVSAQTRPGVAFPDRPVHLIIPAPAGSGPDALGRLLGRILGEAWSQPVIIDNVVGAGGNIGHEKGAKAPADGHTLLMGLIGPMSVNQSMMEKMPFDPVKDLAPVTMLVKLPNILVVNPRVPVKNLQELIAYDKQNPGKLRYGYPGAGTSLHLAAEQLNMVAGTRIAGIPYKTSAQMTTDVLGGHIEVMFHNAPVVLPHIRSGALRSLGITSARRNPAAPDIPTLGEAGLPGFEVTSWYAMYVPAATPKPLVARLNADIAKALASSDVKEWMTAQAGEAGGGTPEELSAFQAEETIKWKKLITAAKIKAE
jgi:tripartite-type tricarboxylate transporter receptor subunit TctC